MCVAGEVMSEGCGHGVSGKWERRWVSLTLGKSKLGGKYGVCLLFWCGLFEMKWTGPRVFVLLDQSKFWGGLVSLGKGPDGL